MASLNASGSAPHRGAAPETPAEGVKNAASQSSQLGISPDSDGAGRSEQGPAEQALHFAHGLLGAVMRQLPKHAKSSKKRDAVGQWVQVRRPSAYGKTQAEMHRKVFQLPALPTHQAQRQPWQIPTAHPTLKILYPTPLAQPADPPAPSQPLHPHHQQQGITNGPPEADGYPAPQPVSAPSAVSGQSDGAVSGTPEAEEEDAEWSPATSAQAASPLGQHPAALTAAADEAEAVEAEADRAAEDDAAVFFCSDAEGGKAGAAAGGAGQFGGVMEQGAYCGRARGLQPRAVAQALAGPTVHILLEGYDVYTDSGLKRKGNDFPLPEVLRVSQDSRRLWLHQQPFKLKRGMPEEVAKGAHRRGGWRQRQGAKVNTKQIALHRQQAVGPPCSVGAAGQPSAFRPFTSPSGLPHSTATVPDSGGSDCHDRPGAASEQSLGRQSHEGITTQMQQHEKKTSDALAAMEDQQQQQQACGQAAQSHEEGRASVHGPDRTRTSDVAPGLLISGAASTASLEGTDDRAMAEQFRDIGGDAWKVFYMASRMGLRPDVIEKAAKRLRSLQQQSE